MLSPAESCAASYCWLARWRSGRPDFPLAKAFDKVDTFWHPGECRFCDTPLPTLMDQIDEAKDRMEKEPSDTQGRLWQQFKALPHKARLVRIREAQERPWYDDVVESAGLTPEPPPPTMPP